MQEGLEGLFHTTFARFGEAAMAIDQRGYVVAGNAAFEDLFGVSLSDSDPCHIDRLCENHLRATGERATIFGELEQTASCLRYRRNDGNVFLGERSDAPIYAADGTYLGLFSIIRDVTDRCSLEAGIRSLHALPANDLPQDLDCLTRFLKLGCHHLNVEHGSLGRIEGDDYIVELVTGSSAYCQVGERVSLERVLTSPTDGDDQPPSRGPKTSYPSLEPIYHRFGTDSSFVSEVRVAGRIYGTLNFADPAFERSRLTERQKLFLHLLAERAGMLLEGLLTRQALSKATQDLDRFVYITSHDLREPLRRVVNYCQILATDHSAELSDDAAEVVEVIETGGKRMRFMLNDLLEYSSLSQQLARTFEPVDMTSVLYQALDDVEERFGSCRLSVEAPHLPLVWGHSSLLRKVYYQLLSNSIKFAGDGSPSINVTLQDHGQYWAFAISDVGIGIDPRFADQIFEIFQRLHSRDDFSGTGAGLAICKQIVEGYGGAIWLDKAFTEGARFQFTLPKDKRLANSIAGSVHRLSSSPSPNNAA